VSGSLPHTFAFNRYPAAPVARAAVLTSASLFCVRKMISGPGEYYRIRFAASIPFRIGIPISRSTRSGRSSNAFWTASRPSHASPMISHSGRPRSISRTRARHSAKSSAIRIVARADEACESSKVCTCLGCTVLHLQLKLTCANVRQLLAWSLNAWQDRRWHKFAPFVRLANCGHNPANQLTAAAYPTFFVASDR